MAHHQSTESSSKSNVSVDNSEGTIQLNVKTLDSQIYSFSVDKNMSVSLFKEKIANDVGLPVDRQRLIFRGKVLKDDHLLSEYYAEDGHTLHLVPRQPTEQSAGSSSGEANGNNAASGADAANGTPRNRYGQVSHGVILGSLNLGDQGNGGMPDFNRVIGGILNSIMGGIPAMETAQPFMSVPRGNETGSTQGNTVGQAQAQTQSQPPQGFQPHILPQIISVPPAGSAQPAPALNLSQPIPDSLCTIMEYIGRMQLALSQEGNQPNAGNAEALPTTELPSNSLGLPTNRALSVVLRHTEQLLSNYVTDALSHAAGRLEQEADFSDPNRRGQLLGEVMRLGLVLQQLGALFLEIGRSTLMLRVGQSSAQAYPYVNAGPAVYISANGPNPIMAQPFPMQTSPLFSSSSSSTAPGTFGLVGIGNATRQVNIHIHAGTSLAPSLTAMGGRVGNANGAHNEQANQAGSDATDQAGAPSVINITGSTMPNHSDAPSAAEINAAIAARLREMGIERGGSQNQSVRVATSTAQTTPDGAGMINDQISNGASNITGSTMPNHSDAPSAAEINAAIAARLREMGIEHGRSQNQSAQTTPEGAGMVNDQISNGASASADVGERIDTEVESLSGNTSRSEKQVEADAAQTVPFGLGLGGLQPKKKVKQQKPQVKASDGESSTASQSRSNTTREAASGQSLTANLMSQVIQSPALDGLLSGVSQQTGIGSPDVLRNMLTQLTQNPTMLNAVSQIAQQVDDQDMGGMLPGMGGQGGGSGGIDFSRILQQMMPVVSQALGGFRPPTQESTPVARVEQPHSNDRSVSSTNDRSSQIDVHPVAQSIANGDPPPRIFQGILDYAVQLCNAGSGDTQLVEELCDDPDLIDSFMAMLHGDVSRRVGDDGSNPSEDS